MEEETYRVCEVEESRWTLLSAIRGTIIGGSINVFSNVHLEGQSRGRLFFQKKLKTENELNEEARLGNGNASCTVVILWWGMQMRRDTQSALWHTDLEANFKPF